jgi:hypothetical protein
MRSVIKESDAWAVNCDVITVAITVMSFDRVSLTPVCRKGRSKGESVYCTLRVAANKVDAASITCM